MPTYAFVDPTADKNKNGVICIKPKPHGNPDEPATDDKFGEVLG